MMLNLTFCTKKYITCKKLVINMKKITMVSIFSFLFLILCSMVAEALKYSALTSAVESIIIGLVFLAISGIVFLCMRDYNSANYFCLFTNAIALGFCIRAWHIYRDLNITFSGMILVSLICVAYLLVFYILLSIPKFDALDKY